jgi:hypothetical protein
MNLLRMNHVVEKGFLRGGHADNGVSTAEGRRTTVLPPGKGGGQTVPLREWD